MRRRKQATSKLHLGDAWALGRRYRRLSVRIRKPIAMSVVLAVVVALTGPTAFAEDPITDPNAPATTESPNPAPDPSSSPAADPITDPSPAPSSEPSTSPATELPSTPTLPEASPEPSPSSVLPIGNPTISSDKDDYPPGGAVILTGTNWQPGELVHIRVNDDAGESWRRDVDVIADGNGTIRDEFQLPAWFVALYTVTATGPISGTATTTFTDGTVDIRNASTTAAGVVLSYLLEQFENTTCAPQPKKTNSFTRTGPNSTGTGNSSISSGGTESVKVNLISVSGGYELDHWNFVDGSTNGDGTPYPNAISPVTTTSFCFATANDTNRTFIPILKVSNTAPVISLPNGPVTYAENAAATIIDAGATATDSDSANFDTGTLTIDYSVGGSADDRLAIRNQGVAAGQIGVSGANITFGGTTIGTFTGGTGTTALVVTFNANSSPTAAQALMRNITYANVSDTPTASRTVRFVLTDGDGGTSNTATKVITVTAVNDTPTISDIADQTINEDTNTGALSFTIGDAETATASLTVTGSSSNITLVPNGNIVFGGSGASRTVTVTPAANKNGTATITVNVSDGSLTGSDTFLLTVRSVNDAPAGANNTVTTAEDADYVFTAANFGFSDPDDSPANLFDSVKITNLPTFGVLKLDGTTITSAGGFVSKTDIDAGKLVFHPNLNENGSPYSSFTFQVKDDGGTAFTGVDLDQSANTMTVNVTAANDAPVVDLNGGAAGIDYAATFTEDGGAVAAVASGALTVADVDNANIASATITLTNRPDGTDESLAVSGCALGITVTAYNSSTGVLALSGSASKADYQACLRTLTYNNADQDPDTAARSITVVVNDGALNSATATSTITVVAVNDAPVAVDDARATDEDTALTVVAPGVLTNDTDAENDSLSVGEVNGSVLDVGVEITLASGALLTLNADGSFTYDPNGQFEGLHETESDTDSFTYKAFDGMDESTAAATVTITITGVSDAPVANDDTGTTDEDSALTVPADGVLGNDTDAEGDTLTVAEVNGVPADVGVEITLASGALLTLNADGSYTYDPNAQFEYLDDTETATDTFTYKANDGDLDSNLAIVTITINGLNDAPAANDDTGTTDEDTNLTVAAPGVLGNDTDADVETITVVRVNGLTASVGNEITLGSGAKVTLNADGSYTYKPNGVFEGLDTGETAIDSFTYGASDGTAESNVASVTITITGVNDAPVAVNDTGTTNEDTNLAVAAPGVLGNDTDADVEPLSVFEVNGVVANVGTEIGLISGAKVTLNADGSYTYKPNGAFESLDTGETATDSFKYKASDGTATSNEATVTITITGVNDAPVAANDTGSTSEDTNLSVAAPGVLSNDTDADVETLTVVRVNGATASVGTEIILASGAKVTLNANGSFTYKPNGAFETLDTGETATDTFTYKASDGTAESNQATVTITITGVNDAPVISSASFGGSVPCPTSSGAINATLSVSFTDIDDENPAFTATIDWDINTAGPDETFAVSEGSFTRDHSYPTVGTYTARVTVSDGTTTASKDATVTVNYNTSGILQPVNWTQAHNDPSIFKWGSTVPVKVRFFNCDGTNAGTSLSVKIQVRWVSGVTPPVGEFEAITNTNSPDSGGFMRSSGDLYLYNLNTGTLSDKTATYEIVLTVQSTGQTVTTLFGTKAK